jgi:Nif11 domain
MQKSQVELFLEKIGTDSKLREKIKKFEENARVSAINLEQEVENNARANAHTMIGIAKEAGYDIPRDFFRQTKSFISPTIEETKASNCTLTCCWVATSCLHTCWWTD